jgi:hypothetical protein
MRNGFIAVVWLLLIGLGVFAWLSTQDYDLSKALRFAQTDKASEPATDAAGSGPAPATAGVAPTFDIVRVEPDGTAVLAGRAGAGADVTVMVDGAAVGDAKADERGEWAVVVDKPLATGNHSLTVASVAGGETSTSEQSVAIAVPQRKDEKPLIVLSQKGEPSKVIQAPESVTTVQTEQPVAEPKADEAGPARPATEETQQQAAAVPAEEAPQQAAPAQAPAPDALAPAQQPAAPAREPAAPTQELAAAPAEEPAAAPAPAPAPAPAAPAATASQPATAPSPAPTSVSVELTFEGRYLALERFFRRLDRFVAVSGDELDATGRLLAVDGMSLASEEGKVTASVDAQVFVLPDVRTLLPVEPAAVPAADESAPAAAQQLSTAGVTP